MVAMNQRGISTALVFAAISLVALAAAASSAIATTAFDRAGFHTRYPSNWSQLHQETQASIGTSLDWLSNQTMSEPCVRTSSGTGATVTCGLPIKHLAPRGTLVEWSRVDGPLKPDSSTLTQLEGKDLLVGGQPAKLTTSKASAPECGDIGATQVMRATIIVNQVTQYNMRACLRGPDLARAQSQIRHMLRETSFAY
jgi:hypothetical protein